MEIPVIKNNKKSNDEKIIIMLFVSLFAFIVLRNAWVSEDAYITFRTIDNFINGYGLTWNTAERVQAYTNPMWMFFLSIFYFFTREIFYTSIFLSIAVSLIAILLFAFKIARSSVFAVIGIIILAFSKAFVDYSTSGLENPMTHLILALFLLVYLKSEDDLKKLFFLSLIAAIGTFNRMDTFLLFLPTLVYVFYRLRKLDGVYAIVLGFLPFIVWELFSLFYYGFLFPNTYYAKLNTGIDEILLIEQGLYYLINSINIDPLTLLIIINVIMVSFITKERRNLPVAIGIIFYMLYVVIIGGDFMSGRFLTAPLFCAVVLLSRCNFTSLIFGIPAWLLVLFLVVLISFSSPYHPLLSDASYGMKREGLIDDKGIADERGYYYQYSGLLKANRLIDLPILSSINDGRKVRMNNSSVIAKGNIGYFGFYAGPNVHIVDTLALADPLLARLPASEINWRIGHYRREIPNGYIETLISRKNNISDKNLAAYYDKLSLITRGKLFDINRLVEIWNLNGGKYDYLIDSHWSSVKD